MTDPAPISVAPTAAPERAAAHRAAWTITSQGLSSASNFVLSALVLANVSARAFAVFALCLTVVLLLLQLGRYLIGVPVLVTQSAGGSPPGTAGPVGLALWAGLAPAAALLVAAGMWGTGRGLLLTAAASIPFLLAQDVLRHVAIAQGRPQVAAAGDAVWVAVQALTSWLLIGAGDPSATALTAAWAASGTASAMFLAGRLGIRPAAWRAARRWLEAHAQLCRRMAGEFAVSSGSYYALCFGLAALAGTSQLGYFRGAQTLFGPASVLLLGGASLGVSESVRIRGQGGHLVRFAFGLSAGLALLSLACGVAVYALVPHIGPTLFPDSSEPIRALMPWLTAFGVALAASSGPISALRALDGSRWVLVGRGVTAALALAIGLPASMWFGAKGTFAGLAVAELILAARAWSALHRRASPAHAAEADGANGRRAYATTPGNTKGER